MICSLWEMFFWAYTSYRKAWSSVYRCGFFIKENSSRCSSSDLATCCPSIGL